MARDTGRIKDANLFQVRYVLVDELSVPLVPMILVEGVLAGKNEIQRNIKFAVVELALQVTGECARREVDGTGMIGEIQLARCGQLGPACP